VTQQILEETRRSSGVVHLRKIMEIIANIRVVSVSKVIGGSPRKAEATPSFDGLVR